MAAVEGLETPYLTVSTNGFIRESMLDAGAVRRRTTPMTVETRGWIPCKNWRYFAKVDAGRKKGATVQ